MFTPAVILVEAAALKRHTNRLKDFLYRKYLA